MNGANLMTYCGACCNACALSPRFTALKEAAVLINELIEVHGLQNWIPQAWLPEAPNMFDFNEFRKGLDFFSKANSFYICQKGCKDGGGFAECIMRKCCRERGLDICFDCTDFPCNKVEWDPVRMKRAEEYKRLGRDKWLQEQEKKARQGFELYADKYYQVRTGEKPPRSK
jgi:hypothetical protein